MIYLMKKPLTKNDVREVVEEVFDRKFDEKFDKKFDEKFDQRIAPFAQAVQLEFEKMNKKIEDNFQWIKDNIYKKLDAFISMYKDNKQEITMLASQSRRLSNRVDNLDKRVLRLESPK